MPQFARDFHYAFATKSPRHLPSDPILGDQLRCKIRCHCFVSPLVPSLVRRYPARKWNANARFQFIERLAPGSPIRALAWDPLCREAFGVPKLANSSAWPERLLERQSTYKVHQGGAWIPVRPVEIG